MTRIWTANGDVFEIVGMWWKRTRATMASCPHIPYEGAIIEIYPVEIGKPIIWSGFAIGDAEHVLILRSDVVVKIEDTTEMVN